ncbi:signal-regulatory protein beta-1-like [Sturnira hondurensis]|uniref:signal-regulatory protein beta-1-like n=1 Tax=Sturnira hondurensis TaxID=192404 RepID=UPI00187A9C2A|nr:signal-regulatory protein beta-1-like [Sturnira hondurensis]
MPLTRVENQDGTFTWGSWILVNSSAHGEAVVLTCLVQHDGQPAIRRNLTLEAFTHRKGRSTDGSSGPQTSAIIFVVFLLGLKVLLVVSFTFTYISRWRNL